MRADPIGLFFLGLTLLLFLAATAIPALQRRRQHKKDQ